MKLSVVKTDACVGSGLCCKTGNCGWGEWDVEKKQCKSLEVAQVVDGVEIHRCGKYAEIVGKPTSEVSPAFGAGCCMSLFNTNRERVFGLVRKERIALPYGGDEQASA
jgi:hypothetical protein